MRVEIHDGLRNPTNISATRVMVYDEFDNPIAVVVQMESGHYIASTVAQKQFPSILAALGINKSLVVTHVDAKKLKPLE